MTETQVRDAIKAAIRHPDGARGIMRDEQLAMGRTIVELGSSTPFPIPRWDWDETLITTHGSSAFIVLVYARRKRRGALSRLVKAIRNAGMTPVIVSPIGRQMPAILAKWGWIQNDQDEWTAP